MVSADIQFIEGNLGYKIKKTDLAILLKTKKKFSNLEVLLTSEGKMYIYGLATNMSSGARYLWTSDNDTKLKDEVEENKQANETISVDTIDVSEMFNGIDGQSLEWEIATDVTTEMDLDEGINEGNTDIGTNTGEGTDIGENRNDIVTEEGRKNTGRLSAFKFKVATDFLDALYTIPEGVMSYKRKGTIWEVILSTPEMSIVLDGLESYKDIMEFNKLYTEGLSNRKEWGKLSLANIANVAKILNVVEPETYKQFLQIKGNKIYTYTESLHVEGYIDGVNNNYLFNSELLSIIKTMPVKESMYISSKNNLLKIKSGTTYMEIIRSDKQDMYDMSEYLDYSKAKPAFELVEKDFKNIEIIQKFSKSFPMVNIRVNEGWINLFNDRVDIKIITKALESGVIKVNSDLFITAYKLAGAKRVDVSILLLGNMKRVLILRGRLTVIIGIVDK